MVFETAIALVLEKVLSKYVEHFERDKLKVGLWGGDVVLRHLKLKATALDDLDLPLRCCYGYLEKLVLKIPWKNIYNDPCIAEIDGFYLLAVPNQHMKYNEEQEKKYAREAKQAELEKIENAKIKELEKDLPAESNEEKKGFFEKLAANIIKNIQINIKNIHIRYEDRISNLGKPFSIGVTLDSLGIKSIPIWGERLNIDPLNLIYKELSINFLCVYWNSELSYEDLYFANIGPQEEAVLLGLQNTICSSTKAPKNFKYLLGPINAQANLRINTKPETDGTNFTVPKFLLRLVLEKLYIRLSKRQYQDITCFLNSLDLMNKAARYRKYRPSCTTVKGHAKEWWKYAYTCVVEDEIRRVKRDWDWLYMFSHRKIVKEYFQIYRDKLLTPKPSKEFLAKLEEVEDKLDILNILLAREIVEKEFTKDQLLRLKKGGPLEEKKESGGWRSWFGGGSKKVEVAEDALAMRNLSANLQADLTEDEKEKLFRAIGFREGEAPALYPEEFVETDLGAVIQEISLEFIDEKLEHPTVMTISFQQALTSIRQWPTIKGLRVDCSISDFIIHGIEQFKSQPKLVSNPADTEKDKPLLQVLFEINPLDKKVDKRIHVFAEPLSIIYDAFTINSLLDVFQTQTEIPSAIQVAAQEKLKEFKQVSSLGLQHMLEVRETVEINVDIKASRVFIPYSGFYEVDNSVIVINLGNIIIFTLPRKKYVAKDVAMLSEAESLRERIQHSYENFILKLTDLQVVYAMKGEKWASPKPDMYFLKPTTLAIDFGKCILDNDPHLPKIKVKAQLPLVEVSIYEVRLKDCLSLLMSIPFPAKDEPSEQALVSRGSKMSLAMSHAQLDFKERASLYAKASKQTVEEVVQFFEMECTFELQEVLIVILTEPNASEVREFLQFRLNHLTASMDKYSFNSNIRLTLSSILLQQNFDEKWIDIVTTPRLEDAEENYLFRVILTMVEKDSPELHTKYKSILQMIDMDFTKLELLFHCEALRSLKNWADDFMESIASKKPVEESRQTLQVVASNIVTSSYSDLKGSLASFTRLRVNKPKPTRIEFIMMKLNGLLGEISISLWTNHERFASLGISGGACSLTLKKSYTVFEIALQGIYMNNHEPSTMYPKILSIKDQKEVLTMKVVSFNNPDRSLGSVDLTVQLSMARLQFVFLNGFLMRILDFLNHFSEAREKFVDASQAAAEAAKQNVKSAYDNAIRIGLDIDLKAPLIVVPVNKRSCEAFTLDLGHITARNSFLDVKVPNASDPAVLDRLKVNLESLKFSRVMYDFNLDALSKEEAIIEPISFNVTIQRNLSSGWFLDLPDLEIGGKLHTIKVSLTHPDYYLLMRTLEENIGDTGSANKQVLQGSKKQTPNRKTELRPDKTTYGPQASTIAKKAHPPKELNVRSTMKFALTLERVIVELITGTDKKDQPATSKEGLARVSLELFSLKGSFMSDDSLHVALILLDILIDDIRPSRVNKISRYMERKKDLANGDGDKPRSMVDITFQQKVGVMFADIRVSSFVMMLNIEHIQKISSFFSAAPEKEAAVVTHDPKLAPARHGVYEQKKSYVTEPIEQGKSKLTLNFKCEHPDIVLVEHLDSLDTNAIVLDFEMIFSMKTGDEKTVMDGSINELQLFSCAYDPERRADTKCPILNPLTIILSGCEEDGAMKINLDSTRIKISVSPGTISLLSSIATSLTGGSVGEVLEIKELVDRSKIWDPQDFYDSDYNFLQTELAVEASEIVDSPDCSTPEKFSSEMCAVKFPEIIIVMESGTGRTTVPILYIDSFFEVAISNWSSKLHMEGKFMLQMKYFNHRHAIWEPLIEPVAVLDNFSYVFYNWTLNFVFEKNPEDDCDTSVQSIDQEEKGRKALMSISVYSPESLNITITKKSLEILQSISTTISDAIYKPEIYTGEKAPYIVKNDSGMSLKVVLDEEFVVFPSSNTVIKDILLDVNCSVGLVSCTQIEYLGLVDETKEKYIHIVIPAYNCDILIPVMKAAKRFFLLQHRGPGNDKWGIVSDVTVVNGQTVITLRGIIQVENTFNMPINIYSMTNKENELHLIGTVEPSEKMNVPIDAIYTQTTELFFSVEGYTVSIVPYIWKDLQNCVQKTKILRCNPKGEDEQARGIPLFLRAIGELEQIYFENTNRHTILSTCFNISIRPTVIFVNVLPVDIVVCMEGIVDEHLLSPAQSIQVPTAEPGVSHIVIRIPDYLDREWSCKNLLEENPPDMLVWTFSSYENATLKMELGAHIVNTNGTHVYSLYCPFWMVNKTGLRLAYKQGDENPVSLLHHPADYNGIIMFSFKAKSFFAKKKSSIRVEDGAWSDKFSLDATGTSGIVICKHENKTYHIGVQIRLVNNALTKEVLFTPFHVFVNSHKYPIEVREIGKENGSWNSVLPNDCLAFWPTSKPDVGKLQVRIAGTLESSETFPYYKSHNSVLKLANKYGAINVDIHITEGGVYISFFAYETGMAPVLLVNHTHHPIDICEKAAHENSVILKPKQQALFTWSTYEDTHFLSFCKGKYTGDLKEDTIGNFTIGNDSCFWSSFLYGLQRVFLFTDSRSIAAESINLVDYEQVSQEIDFRVHGLGVSLVDDTKKTEIVYISLSGSEIVWESRKPGKKTYKRFSEKDVKLIESAYQDYLEALSISLEPNHIVKIERLTVDFKHMLMISPAHKEIRRCYVEGLWANVKTSSHLTRLHLKVNRLQIDQQIYDCIFPVIFAPVPPPKSVMAELSPKPFIEVSVIKLTNQYSHVQQYKYLGILVQEFHVKVDTGLLTNLMSLFQESVTSEQDQKKYMENDIQRSKNSLTYFVARTQGQEVKNYYGKLHLSPLKIHLSFSLSGGESGTEDEEKSSMPPIFNVILRSFGVTLTDLNDVVFKVNYFERDSMLITQTELIKEVQSHYTSQILQQLYVFVLGLDVIGNPFGLLLGFKQGATDLFYEPFQGAIRGPGEFAEGLVLGVRSLFGHTVGGTAGAISKMTGAMGKGLAALTFDDDYQRQRREALRQRPANMQEGLARSGKGLVMGVVEGIGGVITKPISGAKEDGVAGFFKGMGKGMVGLVTRPTAGIVDFASGSLGAVRRATEVGHEVTRVRAPRYIRPDGLVRPYSPREAEGNRYLQQLEKGKYAKTDEYVFHMDIGYAEKHKDILLLTDMRLLYLAYNDIFGGYQLEWEHKWSEMVKDPEMTNEGVRFWVAKQKSLKSIFGSSDNGKVLLVDRVEVRRKLGELIKDCIAKNKSHSSGSGSQLQLSLRQGSSLEIDQFRKSRSTK